MSPRRQILIEGPLLLLDSGKPTEMFVILFDDLLIIARKKKALSKKVKTLQFVCKTDAGFFSIDCSGKSLRVFCKLF